MNAKTTANRKVKQVKIAIEIDPNQHAAAVNGNIHAVAPKQLPNQPPAFH